MKKTFRRGIWFLLVFILSVCQAQTSTQTATGVSPEIKTPTITATKPVPTVTIAPPTGEPEIPAGQIAYAHVEAISEGIGPRVAGTEAESQTATYLVLEFERLGYVSELRPFSVTVEGKVINSANVMAIKPGASSREMIVGAHYDSIRIGKGADDNATGVAVILEVAERLRDQNTPYTIRFLLFGAEEVGLRGSTHYVNQMTDEQIQNTVAMINLDSVAAGDIAYIYGDQGQKGTIRDWALNFAQEYDLALQTQLGENSEYPAGTSGNWSDHAPFKEAGIPYAYLEATNWTLGDKDGYTQVSAEYGESGKIWHTEYDTLEYINSTFPGRMQERLDLFVTVLEAILTEFETTK